MPRDEGCDDEVGEEGRRVDLGGSWSWDEVSTAGKRGASATAGAWVETTHHWTWVPQKCTSLHLKKFQELDASKPMWVQLLVYLLVVGEHAHEHQK